MEANLKTAASHDQLVTFWLGSEELAVPISIVQEIVKRPEIRRVPNAPNFVDGIGNLRGNVLPIVNLRTKLAMAAKEPDESTRVVVLNIAGVATGLVVDRVSEVLRIEASCMEEPHGNLAGTHGQILRAVAKIEGGKRLILILDENKLLPELESLTTQASPGADKVAAETLKNPTEELEQIVTFKIGSEEFSLNIMEVKEIIRITGITPVPQAAANVVGLISLRNHLLPIMDLRLRFGMRSLQDEVKESKKTELLDAQRIVVADLGGCLAGILVDSVSQVLRLDKRQIEAPPPIISSGKAKRVKGVGKLDRGNRLVMQMNLDTLLGDGERQQLAAASGSSAMATEEAKKNGAHSEDEVQLVAFRIAQEEYAMPIAKVQEIIKINQITSVPHTKAYIEGIINLRGSVVPVIDLRARFGIGRKTDLEQRRIVVVQVRGKTNGFIVDSVTEVLRMRTSQIEAAPASITGEVDSSFVDGIGKLNDGKRIIIMVNPDAILAVEAEPTVTPELAKG